MAPSPERISTDSADGWALFSCCVASTHEVNPHSRRIEQGGYQHEPMVYAIQLPSFTNSIPHKQPQPIRASTRESQRHSGFRASLQRSRTAASRRSQYTISAPSDFRPYDESHDRPQSFHPLELSILEDGGRLSPLPDFKEEGWSDEDGSLQRPAPAMVKDDVLYRPYPSRSSSLHSSINFSVKRKPLYSSDPDTQTTQHQRLASNATWATVSTGILHEDIVCDSETSLAIRPSVSRDGNGRLVSNIVRPEVGRKRPKTAGSAIHSFSSTSTSRSRSNSLSQHARKLSFQRSKTDIEEAIAELNIIVEEKRLSAMRLSNNLDQGRLMRKGSDGSLCMTFEEETSSPNSHSSPHIPAVVPTMKVHARSETLSEIGSVFSTPLNKPLPGSPQPSPRNLDTKGTVQLLSERSVERSRTSSTAEQGLFAGSKIATWLRQSLPAVAKVGGYENADALHRHASISEATPQPQDRTTQVPLTNSDSITSPFYKCQAYQAQQRKQACMASTSSLSSFMGSSSVATSPRLSSPCSTGANTVATVLTRSTNSPRPSDDTTHRYDLATTKRADDSLVHRQQQRDSARVRSLTGRRGVRDLVLGEVYSAAPPTYEQSVFPSSGKGLHNMVGLAH